MKAVYAGQLRAPASKSYLQRALLLSSLAMGPSTLRRVSWCEDALAMKRCMEEMGSRISVREEDVSVTPGPINPSTPMSWHVGQSGLALRMLCGVAAWLKNEITIDGEQSLLQRPISPILDTYARLGVEIHSEKGQLPMHFCNGLSGGEYHIDAAFSSQILSGLLIALPLCDRASRLFVRQATSLPYIDMTLHTMSQFGVAVENVDYKAFRIPGNQKYAGSDYTVEGDWSGAANHLVGAAICGEVNIIGLRPDSLQSDRSILDVLRACGAEVGFDDSGVWVKRGKLIPFDFDASNCPDLFPPLVVLAASCRGQSSILGIHRLIHKESNRLESMLQFRDVLGLDMQTRDDRLMIYGTGQLRGGQLHAFADHRIAMVAAIANCISESPVTIDCPSVVSKSYPAFYDDFNRLLKAKDHPQKPG